jgi:hypothetical protein
VKETTVQDAYVVTATLRDARTLTLDEPLPWETGRVRVVVEPVSPTGRPCYGEVVAAIRERQLAQGHQAPGRAEVDADLRAERDSWPE